MRALVITLALLAACTTEKSGAEWGEELFADPHGLTRSNVNTFSCATCHRTTAEPEAGDDRILPGYSLHGVAARERFWGGSEIYLHDAVDVCIVYFMRGTPLDLASDESRALEDFLASITPPGSPTATLPMTVVENIVPLPLGDAGAGAEIYRRACQNCHGEAHTGDGHILDKKIVLPEVTGDYATLFPGVPTGLVVTEVVRHGRFFDVGTTMPLFTVETLSDAELGDLLAFLGTPTE
jgi:thiosulfate dehydrogenase